MAHPGARPDRHRRSLGIYLFFIVSGFVIFMTLERSARATEAVGWDPDHAIWVAVLCAIVVATACGSGVEVPAQKAIRGWYQESRQEYLVAAS